MNRSRNIQLKKLEKANTRLRQDLTLARSQLDDIKHLLEGAHDGLWLYDLETGRIWSSTRWWRTLGYSQQAIPATLSEMFSFVHPEDVVHLEAAFRAYIQGNTDEFKCEFRIRTCYGENRVVRSRGSFVHTPQGAPKLISGTHTDITDIRKQEEHSRQLLQMFELIFENIPHLIGVKNANGQFLFANAAMAKFYGANSPYEMINKRDDDYNKKIQQVSHFLEDDMLVITSRRPKLIPKEENTDHRGRKHWLTTIKAPLVNPDGTVNVVFVATFIDELMRLQSRIRKTSEMAELAKMLAHKLGTRIYTLETYVSKVAAASKNESAIRAALEDIKQFQHDFLELSLAGRLKPQKTNLMLILSSALHPIAGNAIITINNKLIHAAPSEDPNFEMVADERKLVDVFSQLGKNSLEWANKSPHRITVTVQPLNYRWIPNLSIQAETQQRPRKYRITFQDNGPGISQDQRKVLFKPFASGKSGGTGLGLAIIHGVIEAHGGTIKEKGEAQGGASFEIILPTTLKRRDTY